MTTVTAVGAGSPITVPNLGAGNWTFTVQATNAYGTGSASISATATVTSTATPVSTYPNVAVTLPALTRSGANLQVSGATKRFSGMNAYWLGLDDNAGTSSGSYPSQATVTAAMWGMRGMGVNLVRAHTVGISQGVSSGNGLSYATYSSSTGAVTYNDAALASADWAVYQASLQGIYLMVPLTDNWNYYHGGKWVFCHAAYLQNSSGLVDCPGTTKDDPNERQFFAASAAALRIRAVFKDYISHLLNHVNRYTGVAYKNDPTIAIVETGNETYVTTQPNASTLAPDPGYVQDICSYIKSIAPNKLTADGAAASGTAVSSMQGLTAAACDVVGNHYYPQNPSAGYSAAAFGTNASDYPAGSAEQQLVADVASATSSSKAFVLGEYPWTRSDVSTFWSQIESTAGIDGDMAWSFIGGTETHGGAFGSDDFPVHWPYQSGSEAQYAPALATHIHTVSGVALAAGAGAAAPVTGANLITPTTVQHASTVAPFTAGSCTLAVDTTTYEEGGSSIRVTPSGSGVYPYFYPTAPTTGGFPVTAGQPYTGMVAIRPTTTNDGTAWLFTALISFYTSSGSYITPASSGLYQSANISCPSGAWTNVPVTVTAPATAAYAIVQPQAGNPMSAGDVFNVDQFGAFAGTVNAWSASGT